MANRGNLWTVPAGQSQTFTLTIKGPGGTAIPYGGTEALPTTLWEGGSLSPITGVLAAAWHSAAAGTVDVLVTPGALMEPGFYRIRLSVTANSRTNPYYNGWLKVDAVPGVADESPVYCTLQDCLDKAGSWLLQLMQGGAGDQTNYNVERAEARQWLDDIIIAASRPYSYRIDATYALIYSTFPFGPVENPDTVVTGYLAADQLIVRARTIECTVYKSLAFICEKRISADEAGEEYKQRAAWYHKRASNSLRRYRAEIDITGDGRADLAFNLGVVSMR